MIKVQNVDKGPRGIHVGGVVVMLEPGESRELDLNPSSDDKDRQGFLDAGNIKAAKKSGWFEFGAKAEQEDEADDALGKLTDDELRGYLEARNVKADGRWSRERLLTEAEKVKA